jgi:hypothetical protein
MDKCQEKKPSEEIRANVSKESDIRHLYTQLLYILFTHRHFFTQTLLHTQTLYARTLLHTNTFTHGRFYEPRLGHTLERPYVVWSPDWSIEHVCLSCQFYDIWK